MGFYRQRTKCQFLHGPTYGPAYGPASGSTHAPSTTTLGRLLDPNTSAPLPTTTTPPRTLHSPAAVARLHPATAPSCRHLAAPSNRTRPARHNRPDTASQTQPGQPQPSRPHPVTQLAASTQSRHLVTTFSHQPRWCAKPVRPAPAQPSGAAQGR